MSRGVHRVVIRFRRDRVDVRAQSKSPRGSPYTVGALTRVYETTDGRPDKSVLEKAVEDVLNQAGGSTPK